jgi:ATP-binding cassette subfamily F protein 3
MLLRPSNTLLLDEPTNHLDLDSKEVLLDALVDYGGTLIFVSHDRYFVERLATKIIEVGHGTALVYPGTYKEFLWHKEHPQEAKPDVRARQDGRDKQDVRGQAAHDRRDRQDAQNRQEHAAKNSAPPPKPKLDHAEKKRADAEARREQKALQAKRAKIDDLEAKIAVCENAIKEIEQTMSAPGFYDDREAAQPVIDRHQALMWEVGDLMHRWEELQSSIPQ